MEDLSKREATADLTRAIVRACERDPRPFVQIYAGVVQSDGWVRLWRSLSIAERGQVVAQAKREAGR